MDLKSGDGYEVKKTLGKFTEGLGYTIVTAVLLAVVKHLEGIEGLEPQEGAIIGLAVSVLYAVHNLIKHYKDK
jgi:hypothetical protein